MTQMYSKGWNTIGIVHFSFAFPSEILVAACWKNDVLYYSYSSLVFLRFVGRLMSITAAMCANVHQTWILGSKLFTRRDTKFSSATFAVCGRYRTRLMHVWWVALCVRDIRLPVGRSATVWFSQEYCTLHWPWLAIVAAAERTAVCP